MRVIVVGGTVFIGRAIVHELAAAGHDVCVVHRGQHEPDDLPDCRHIHVSRDELPTKRDEIAEFAPDALIDNIGLSRATAETTLSAVPEGIRLVVISSVDVYRAYGALHAGKASEPLPIDETSPVREQRFPYRGQIPGMDDYEKLDVEEVYLARNATVLRLPMVYGPHDYQRREEFLLRRVRAGRERIPVGPGTWLGDKGYVADIARGVRLALESADAPGEIFNIGEARTYPMSVWSQMILDAADSKAELVQVPEDKLPEDLGMTGSVAQHLLVDTSKARRVLGFTDTDPVEALGVTVQWHLAHPPEGSDDDFSADDAALAAAPAG